MKRSLLILSFLLISVTSLFSLGLGAAWEFDLNSHGSTGVLQVSHEAIPGTILGVHMSISDNVFDIGITDDWWLYKENLTGPLHLAIGPGLYFGGHIEDNNSYFNIGGRIAIDLRFFALDPLEFFLEYAPSVGVNYIGSKTESVHFPSFNFTQMAIGFRFWF